MSSAPKPNPGGRAGGPDTPSRAPGHHPSNPARTRDCEPCCNPSAPPDPAELRRIWVPFFRDHGIEDPEALVDELVRLNCPVVDRDREGTEP